MYFQQLPSLSGIAAEPPATAPAPSAAAGFTVIETEVDPAPPTLIAVADTPPAPHIAAAPPIAPVESLERASEQPPPAEAIVPSSARDRDAEPELPKSLPRTAAGPLQAEEAASPETELPAERTSSPATVIQEVVRWIARGYLPVTAEDAPPEAVPPAAGVPVVAVEPSVPEKGRPAAPLVAAPIRERAERPAAAPRPMNVAPRFPKGEVATPPASEQVLELSVGTIRVTVEGPSRPVTPPVSAPPARRSPTPIAAPPNLRRFGLLPD